MLADPQVTSNKCQKRGKYFAYTDEDRAKIAKYTVETGIESACKGFREQFPNLNESTIRNFKKLYLAKLKAESKKENPEVISVLPVKTGGGYHYCWNYVDDKLIKILRVIRSKGGIVNIHVVCASADALIKSNPSLIQHFHSFEMSRLGSVCL